MDSLDDLAKERVAFVATLGFLAALDGVTEDEASFINDIASIYGLSEQELAKAVAKKSEADIFAILKYITTPSTKLELIRELFFLGYADGNLSTEEVLFVSKVGESLGVPVDMIERISDWVIRGIEWEEEGAEIFA